MTQQPDEQSHEQPDEAGHLEPGASEIGAAIAALGGWRAATLSRLRTLIAEADPEVVEELKWKKPTNPAGVPTWSAHGLLCTGEAYTDHVKITFARGALLDDPDGLFNASLSGNARRAIDLSAHDEIDDSAFQRLVRAAVTLNKATTRGR